MLTSLVTLAYIFDIEFLKKMRKFRWLENEPVFRELKGLDHKIKIDQGLKGIRKTVEGD